MVELNHFSAMRTLNKLFGFQADPVECELLLTIGTRSVKIKHWFSLSARWKKRGAFSEFILYSVSLFASSSTKGRNTDSMLLGLTNIEWDSSFVAKMMTLGSELLTLNTFPLCMFLNISPFFIIVFPLVKTVGSGVSLDSFLASFRSPRQAAHLTQVDERDSTSRDQG